MVDIFFSTLISSVGVAGIIYWIWMVFTQDINAATFLFLTPPARLFPGCKQLRQVHWSSSAGREWRLLWTEPVPPEAPGQNNPRRSKHFTATHGQNCKHICLWTPGEKQAHRCVDNIRTAGQQLPADRVGAKQICRRVPCAQRWSGTRPLWADSTDLSIESNLT